MAKGQYRPPYATIEKRHVVYHLYGEDREVLYIGCSYNLAQRLRYHTNAGWWPYVLFADWRLLESRADAKAAEKEDIQRLRPFFNIQGTGKYPDHSFRWRPTWKALFEARYWNATEGRWSVLGSKVDEISAWPDRGSILREKMTVSDSWVTGATE